MSMQRRKVSIVLLLGGLLLGLSSCQKPSPSTDGGAPAARSERKQGPALAEVNGEVITVAEFQEEIEPPPEYTQNQLRTGEQKLKRPDNMIKDVLLRQEAHKRSLDEDAEIQRKVARYRDRLITEKLYQQVAQERGAIDDVEVQTYYDEHKNQYTQKERIRASQILILVPPNADAKKDAEARAKAEEVAKKAKGGADFAELAKQYSEGPTAVRGGDLGYFSRGRMVPEFEEVAFSLTTVGDTSDVVKTKFGYHVVKLTDRQPEKQLTLDEVKDRIVRQLESKNRREIRQNLDQELREKANVKVHDDRLQDESEPPSEAPSEAPAEPASGEPAN